MKVGEPLSDPSAITVAEQIPETVVSANSGIKLVAQTSMIAKTTKGNGTGD